MRDRLQTMSNEFCKVFGLKPVMIEFAEEFTGEDIKLWNFLFAPTGHEEMIAQLLRERAEARKDILWRDLIKNPRKVGAVAMIEEADIRILYAAIMMCEDKDLPKLAPGEIETARIVAGRIQMLHAERKVLREIKELYKKMHANAGKLPVFVAKGADFDIFLHEAIHYILLKNGIFTNLNPFDEGLCTYLHLRFRRNPVVYLIMYYFGGRRDYLRWSKYFNNKFRGVPSREIGILLEKNLRTYLAEFEGRLGRV